MAKRFVLALTLSYLLAGCASDKARLKESREAYLRDDFAKAETAIYTAEILKNDQNRLLHYYLLSSIAMSEGQYEKAILFLNKARDLAKSVRSSSGAFEWFSSDYRSNPIEYSYIHYQLVMANLLLAQAGETPAWTTPEFKDEKGNILVPGTQVSARKYSNREIADCRMRAIAELKAWDTHLQDLRRTYPDQDFYKEDVWARLLASFVHSLSDSNSEKRTAELLTEEAKKIFEHEFKRYPSADSQRALIQGAFNHFKEHAVNKQKAENSLFVFEAGVMPHYKMKRFHLGLTTLFGAVKDPGLRSAMEQIGLHVILEFAPEFGLIAFAGGVAGSVGGGGEDEDSEFDGPPQFFSEAVDRSLGFEVRFPTIALPPADTVVALQLQQGAQPPIVKPLSVISPLQEIMATELKNREGSEMFQKAVRIGLQYLAVLIPAIKVYQAADREGNALKKLAVLAGYYISKKVIDNANNPDLRSWDYLPRIIAADVIDVPKGSYQSKIAIQNSFGKFEKDLGIIQMGPQNQIVRIRVGDVPVLNHKAVDSSVRVH